MQRNIGICFLLLSLLVAVQAKPTFDKLAEVLLDVIDERPQYPRPAYYARPAVPSGPLIQEGYDHGYDYYYGGGGGHAYGNVVPAGNPYSPPPPAYGYYPRPVQGPVKGYYPNQPYQQTYAPTGPTYGHGYGRSGHEVGGYKQHGY